MRAKAIRRLDGADGRPGAEWVLDLEHDARFESLELALRIRGRMPLPPYIRRDPDSDADAVNDRERYQTVFAAHSGAIGADRGLHFTSDLLERLRARDVAIASLTLHVERARSSRCSRTT